MNLTVHANIRTHKYTKQKEGTRKINRSKQTIMGVLNQKLPHANSDVQLLVVVRFLYSSVNSSSTKSASVNLSNATVILSTASWVAAANWIIGCC
jgi:hypothetical protein